MKLSKFFTLEELTHSDIAPRLDIDNTPSPEIIENLRWLATQVLDPLRETLGRPLFVSSGYRCPALNRAVGGALHSDHQAGLAADLTCPPITPENVISAVRTLAPFVPLKQAILEFPPSGWVHVSALRASDVDDYIPEFLVATRVNGQTKYSILA